MDSVRAVRIGKSGDSGAGQAEHLALLSRSRAMEEELRHLSRSLLASHEEERLRISRELHDALGQDLTAVNIHLAALGEAAAAVGAKGFRKKVALTQRLVHRSMRTVHEFARSLRPKLLDDLGLGPALRGIGGEFARAHGIRVVVSAPAESFDLGVDRRTALFRVAQEALVNVRRHARAKNVRIALRRIPGGARLEIWNDGKTFDVFRIQGSRTNRHLGLLCMRERMDMVGGTWSIESAKGRGTTVRAEVGIPPGKGRGR